MGPKYYLREKKLKDIILPYVTFLFGANLNFISSVKDEDCNDSEDSFSNFIIAPALGVIVPINSTYSFNIKASYDYYFGETPLPSIRNGSDINKLTIAIGIYLSKLILR